MDSALVVPQGSLNNSAGESLPTARSSFRVGVTEDKNKKCRRTMEDTHAYLYNFLGSPTPASQAELSLRSHHPNEPGGSEPERKPPVETDNGYFAIFDGHAGTFAAEWCGKKLHLILEDTIKNNPNAPVPMLLDQTFTIVDQQLEQLPLKNSGCTAVIAVLRWEDRAMNSTAGAPDVGNNKLNSAGAEAEKGEALRVQNSTSNEGLSGRDAKTSSDGARQRVLYTANVGDARIILCRNGKALRLSYDHKGSDENEGMRITNAGGMILNNRVNGVLAVTRALGDSYMKDFVTGHPFTTETIIQPDSDEFLILACDGLWDVCSDQEAVDLIRNTHDPQAASKILVDHALSRFSTDNLSCMVVRFDSSTHSQGLKPNSPTRDSSSTGGGGGASDADKNSPHARQEFISSSQNSKAGGGSSSNAPADTAAAGKREPPEPAPNATPPRDTKGDARDPTPSASPSSIGSTPSKSGPVGIK
ncbi:mgpp2cl-1, protein phosphatase 2C-like protein 1 [Ophidiomyces ophidiicola]|nr:mgpp2cl-1, protein phosphatase 2C-like protein 1 [Ophidiomyces ophidiicola]KAI1991879.1 mgpp2cl-1, protein phosphatase 2C-like protein 1 [Ophidiomyces ophidiicola]KAI1996476.1 mgpp2cl-1, protein phosphatase 2C-like protein 1 [Ophidiomyces ophidiicola]